MVKIDVAGLKVDAVSKSELTDTLCRWINAGQKTFITTLYSEFLYAALRDRGVLEMLNKADMAVADGIGVMWAAKFLSIPLTAEGYWTKILQAKWQMVYSGAMIILRPKWIASVIPEKIVGADLIWDLAKLASDKNLSVFLLGGFGDTPELVKQKLISRYPNIAVSVSNKNPDDPTVVDDIKKAAPDLLFVAYGPLKQEAWIAQNLPNLPIKLAIGLGGTFDYIAGKRPNPPHFLRYAGLEWLYRLITQPRRFKRIINATFGLVWNLVKYKVFSNLPYRQNVVGVVMNDKNEVFIARFNPEKKVIRVLGYDQKRFNDYWQLPQGGLETDEDLEEGARRELWEETAMRNLELMKISEKTFSYKWPAPNLRAFLSSRRYRYKGQEQHIVIFRFTGTPKEVVLDLDELLEHRWVPLADLEKELAEEKKPLARIVRDDLKNLA